MGDTDRILEALALLSEAVEQDPAARAVRLGWHADFIRDLKSKDATPAQSETEEDWRLRLQQVMWAQVAKSEGAAETAHWQMREHAQNRARAFKDLARIIQRDVIRSPRPQEEAEKEVRQCDDVQPTGCARASNVWTRCDLAHGHEGRHCCRHGCCRWSDKGADKVPPPTKPIGRVERVDRVGVLGNQLEITMRLWDTPGLKAETAVAYLVREGLSVRAVKE
jgi:hypothetical protein